MAGTYRLAAAITGLEPELLALLASDQITHDTIAGYAVPQRCTPVLLALGDRNGPIFHRAGSKLPRRDLGGLDFPRAVDASTPSEVQALVAIVLGQLMFGRARSVSTTVLPAQFEPSSRALVADGILDARRETYRASHVALYSCYQLPCAPARSTDNQWEELLTTRENPTDKRVGGDCRDVSQGSLSSVDLSHSAVATRCVLRRSGRHSSRRAALALAPCRVLRSE